MEKQQPVVSVDWDEARAREIQAAVQARVEQAMREIPVDHPRRQAWLNVLANEPAVFRSNVERRDAIVWGWLDGLEHMLSRWKRET